MSGKGGIWTWRMTRISPSVVDSCIRCHEGPDRVAQEMPFSDPSLLFSVARGFKSRYGYGSLYDSIEITTDPTSLPAHLGGLRMPFGGRPLTQKEIQD